MSLKLSQVIESILRRQMRKNTVYVKVPRKYLHKLYSKAVDIKSSGITLYTFICKGFRRNEENAGSINLSAIKRYAQNMIVMCSDVCEQIDLIEKEMNQNAK